jgi:hypothetical protein
LHDSGRTASEVRIDVIGVLLRPKGAALVDHLRGVA